MKYTTLTISVMALSLALSACSKSQDDETAEPAQASSGEKLATSAEADTASADQDDDTGEDAGEENPLEQEPSSARPPSPSPTALGNYRASDFEPSWSVVINGNNFAFAYPGQTDRVEHLGTITSQTSSNNGQDWTLSGTADDGTIILIQINAANNGCVHSGSGENMRDDVQVTFGPKAYAGCGDPV